MCNYVVYLLISFYSVKVVEALSGGIFTSIPSTFGIQECIETVTQKHLAEFEFGSKAFGTSGSNTNNDGRTFDNEAFISRMVKKGYAGPSESKLENGNVIFETKNPILSQEECNYFIDVAKDTIRKEKEADLKYARTVEGEPEWKRTNSDLGEVRLSNLPPHAVTKLRDLLANELYPILVNRFNVQNLAVYDGLILGNIAPSKSQPVHRDASLLTLNIALSSPEDFEGGGTYIEGLENSDGLPLLISKGKALCHSSSIMHAGNGISNGERWVLVLFVISQNDVQVARRAHAECLDHIDNGRLENAIIAIETGLQDSPHDHVLHMSKGQVASMRGNKQESIECLAKAAALYPPSHRGAMTLGKMLESKRRPRAALRRFESVLTQIQDKDLLQQAWMPLKATAWDARVSAGRCALLCAEVEAQKNPLALRERSWSKCHLPAAIERLETALMFVPGDEYIISMLDRAKELFYEANNFSAT